MMTSQLRSTRDTLTWGDQGDGTYRNPVLYADYSDPDVIRVGQDFYMICSEFHFMGIPVLHSRDLVNWTIVGRVYDSFEVSSRYSEMRSYGRGSWAPSIRFHNETFYVYFNTPSDGLFMYRTQDVRGEWEGPFQLNDQKGCEDPCPFWDDNGKAYLGHSVLGGGPVIIREMNPDGTKLLDDGRVVHWGPISEGVKIHKFGKYYYLSVPEGGVGNGWQLILRSEHIYGPYEKKITLEQGSSPINGPHQGSIVDTPDGEWWFLHFQDTEDSPLGKLPLGRVLHLQPIHWENNWPMMGVEKNGKQEPVLAHPKPAGLHSEPCLPQTDDDFSEETLGLQWSYNHNPLRSHCSLKEHKKHWRVKPHGECDPMKARNTITQKLMGETGYSEVTVHTEAMSEGQHAGLVFLSGSVQGIFVTTSEDDSFVVETRVNTRNGDKPCVTTTCLPSGIKTFRLRVDVDLRGETRFSWQVIGGKFNLIDGTPLIRGGHWKGAKLGLCAYGPEGGHVDFSNFVYEILG